jgi:hypothetical protein
VQFWRKENSNIYMQFNMLCKLLCRVWDLCGDGPKTEK